MPTRSTVVGGAEPPSRRMLSTTESWPVRFVRSPNPQRLAHKRPSRPFTVTESTPSLPWSAASSSDRNATSNPAAFRLSRTSSSNGISSIRRYSLIFMCPFGKQRRPARRAIRPSPASAETVTLRSICAETGAAQESAAPAAIKRKRKILSLADFPRRSFQVRHSAWPNSGVRSALA